MKIETNIKGRSGLLCVLIGHVWVRQVWPEHAQMRTRIVELCTRPGCDARKVIK